MGDRQHKVVCHALPLSTLDSNPAIVCAPDKHHARQIGPANGAGDNT
ncbi:hypothetical protein [Asticcacaulis benevestitus]|nr:hypothetical protein [Asticcacaulis benevestitus]